MTPTGARKVVIFSMVITGGLALFREIKSGDVPQLRIFIGTLFAAVFLAALSDAAPRLAASFAGIIVVSTLVTTTTSADTLKSVGNAINRSSK